VPSLSTRCVAACATLCLVLACSVYTEDLLEPGAGGSGAGSSGCTSDTECEGDGFACHRPVCSEGACTIENAASGASCEGSKFCTTDGECVECVVEQQCPAAQTCSAVNTCVDPSCTNMARDSAETDIDCGGGGCDPCANGKMCSAPGDCVSGLCVGVICTACQNKTDCAPGQYCDVGICKATVAAGETCTASLECETGQCIDAVCCDTACAASCESCNLVGSAGTCTPIPNLQDPDDECEGADICNGAGLCYCADGMKNGDETALDCGGVCSGCADGLACEIDSDCLSKICTLSSCQVPACDDFVHNGLETDVDCGGTCPNKCADNKGCIQASDCFSGVCENNLCTPPTCGDMVTNGAETCDDGNSDSYDGCSSTCVDPVMHLILSEFAWASRC